MLLKKIFLGIVVTTVFAWGSVETRYNNEYGICHGNDGKKTALGKSKEIRGMEIEEIVNAMHDYASKKRPALIMIQSMKKSFVNANSEKDLHDIAIYINKL